MKFPVFSKILKLSSSVLCAIASQDLHYHLQAKGCHLYCWPCWINRLLGKPLITYYSIAMSTSFTYSSSDQILLDSSSISYYNTPSPNTRYRATLLPVMSLSLSVSAQPLLLLLPVSLHYAGDNDKRQGGEWPINFPVASIFNSWDSFEIPLHEEHVSFTETTTTHLPLHCPAHH